MNIILGAIYSALSKSSLTREAPRPENFCTNSLPDNEKKLTPVSPALALASNVFPVPGGPVNKTPFGTWAPIYTYFLLSERK